MITCLAQNKLGSLYVAVSGVDCFLQCQSIGESCCRNELLQSLLPVCLQKWLAYDREIKSLSDRLSISSSGGRQSSLYYPLSQNSILYTPRKIDPQHIYLCSHSFLGTTILLMSLSNYNKVTREDPCVVYAIYSYIAFIFFAHSLYNEFMIDIYSISI